MKKPRNVVTEILKSKDLRPFWARQDDSAHRWDQLTKDERRLLSCLLLEKGVTATAERLKVTVDDVVMGAQRALPKLGFETIGDMCDFHAQQVFGSAN